MRRFIQGFAACYLATAILFGVTMNANMPALNWKGAVYYGAIWPAWPISAGVGSLVVPIPDWSFTFEKEAHS